MADRSTRMVMRAEPLSRMLVHALHSAKATQESLRAELDRVRRAATELSIQTPEAVALRESLAAMSVRLAEMEVEANGLRARLEAAGRPALKPARLETELEVAATELLPRVDFIGSSMNFIAVELPNRSILWRALLALDRQERGQPTGWKSVAGHPGWWERHFSTGQDNQGRLYARLVGQPARWQVLVSHKQEQAGDFRRISKM